jgi:hypothetical protein
MNPGFQQNMMVGHGMPGPGMQQGQLGSRQALAQVLGFFQQQQANQVQSGGGWRAEVPPAERLGFVNELYVIRPHGSSCSQHTLTAPQTNCSETSQTTTAGATDSSAMYEG